MTARHQIRVGNRRLGRDRAAIDATPAPPVGETLQLARERKGVDLFRAERDTKIRLRYLSALEDGAYDELPAAVYTKGFLRNYAIYLGLDPEELVERWRDEMETIRSAERVVSVAPPPQPIVAPRQGLTFSPSMLVAGLVAVVVVLFVGFIGVQFMRFLEIPPVGLTNPQTRYTEMDAESVMLEGTSGPGSSILITGPGDTPYSTAANESGEWQREVRLTAGRNDFRIIATDPVTQKRSDELALTIVVPLPDVSPGVSPTTQPPAPLQLTISGPAEGLTSTDGVIVVSGSTSAARVMIASQYMGAAGCEPLPSIAPPTAPPTDPSASPGCSPAPAGPQSDVTVPVGGSFSEELNFLPGSWLITITGSSNAVEPVSETRTITVSPLIVDGLQVVLQVENRDSWVRIVADGRRVDGYGGRTLKRGETHTITAVSEICVRSGNAGALRLTINGLEMGLLGRNGEVGNFILRPGAQPLRTSGPC